MIVPAALSTKAGQHYGQTTVPAARPVALGANVRSKKSHWRGFISVVLEQIVVNACQEHALLGYSGLKCRWVLGGQGARLLNGPYQALVTVAPELVGGSPGQSLLFN